MIEDESGLVENSFTPSSPLAFGTVYWRVSAFDASGNESDFSIADNLTIFDDTSSPSVALTYSHASPVPAGPLAVFAEFSEPLETVPDISVTRPGGYVETGTMSGSGTSWRYDYNVHCADGDTWQDGSTTVDLANASDGAGNASSAPTNATFTVDTSSCSDQIIAAAEYFYNQDPGEGNATALFASDGAFDEAEEDIEGVALPVDELGTGLHTVFVRFKRADGVWGLARPVGVENIFRNPQNFIVQGDDIIQQAEYFVDSDPGEGQGTTILPEDGVFDEAEEILLLENLDISGIGPGMHAIYLRVMDDSGRWGPLSRTHFQIYNAPAILAAAEYFFDSDPGEGAGVPLPAEDGDFDEAEEVAELAGVSVGGLSEGVHTLYVRFQNQQGRWGTPSEMLVGVNRPSVNGVGTFSQPLAGDGRVPVAVDVADSASADCRLKVEYSLNESEWMSATVDPSDVSVSYGTQPAVDNHSDFQVGGPGSYIQTDQGINRIDLVWLSRQDLDDVSVLEVWLRFTVENVQSGQTTSFTQTPFALDNVDPDTPVLKVYAPDPTGNRRPTLEWQISKEAFSYRVQISTTPYFSSPILDESGIVDHSFQPPDDLPFGTVFWRASAFDAQGNESPFSVADSFEIVQDTSAPSVVLTYSHASPVPAGPLTVFAQFSEPLATTPEIAIDRPGDEIVTAPMSGGPENWQYTWFVHCADGATWEDGETTIAISNAFDSAGNPTTPPGSDSFTVDTTICNDMNIAAGEYFFNEDPGEGNGVPLTALDGAFNEPEEDVVLSDLPVDQLGTGFNTVFVRFKRADGLWGMARPVAIESIFRSPYNFIVAADDWIHQAEYFVDSDPGEGQGTPIYPEDGAFDEAEEGLLLENLDVSDLGPGQHRLYTRVMDNSGRWGPARQTPFQIYDEPAAIAAAEYFFDADPGEGLGAYLPAADGVFDEAEEDVDVSGVSTSGLSDGLHSLFVRFQNRLGRWGEPAEVLVGINLPTVNGAAAVSQPATGDGRIPVELDVSDAGGADCRLKVEYSLNEAVWTPATVDPSEIAVAYGALPSVDNGQEFQVGGPGGYIETDQGANRVSLFWLSGQDLHNMDVTEVWLRFTVENVVSGLSSTFVEGPFAVDNLKPDTPVIIPYAPDPTGNRQPTLEWEVAKGAFSYRVQVSTTPAFSSTVVDKSNIVANYYRPSTPLPLGILYWRVSAIDDIGNQSSFSTADRITIVEDATPPTVVLTYSQSFPVPAGPLIVFAEFSEPLATTPQISISRAIGQTETASMSGAGAFWQYTYFVHCADGVTWDDGAATVEIANAFDGAGNECEPPDNDFFTVDTSGCSEQAISEAEYFFDEDPGEGNGVPLTPMDGAFDEAEEDVEELSIPVNDLAAGLHTVFVRFKRADGVWGLARPAVIENIFRSPHNLVLQREEWIHKAEYFIDSDPGEGNATPIYPEDGAFDEPEEDLLLEDIDTTDLQPGTHTLYARVMDNSGRWGPLSRTPLEVYDALAVVRGAEYYIDDDPGEGYGNALPAADGAFDEAEEDVDVSGISTGGLSEGIHTLYIRFINDLARWSAPVGQPFGVNRPVAFSSFAERVLNDEQRVQLNVVVADNAGATCSLKVDYSTGDGSWSNIEIEEGSLTASAGSPVLDNGIDSQIGDIPTATGPNELGFIWPTATADFSGATEIQIRFTVYNGTYTTSTEIDFDPWLYEFIDEQGPTIADLRFDGVPVTDGDDLANGGTFSFQVSDELSSVDRVLFYIDGQLQRTFTSPDQGYSYHFDWDLDSVADGPYAVEIEAHDELENVATLTANVNVALAPPPAPVILQPVSGLVVNTGNVSLAGTTTLDANTVLVYLNDAVDPQEVIPQDGSFSLYLALEDGENRVRAEAVNRAGIGPSSAEVTVVVDMTIPGAPENLVAQSREGGGIRLVWEAPDGDGIDYCDIYRATNPFLDPANAVKVNSGQVTGLTYDDYPAVEATYYYRVVGYNDAGSASEVSDQASAVSDRTPPSASQITYAPSGEYDEQTRTYGTGTVQVELTVSETLSATPFLSIAFQGGVSVSVPLAKTGALSYQGVFEITSGTPSGTAQAVFSARDLVGNRGTAINSGASILVDTDGPAVVQIVVTPPEPIENDSENPVQIQVQIELSEAVKTGENPELYYRFSESLPDDTLVALTEQSSLVWTGTFTAPAEAGQDDPEILAFSFEARDLLNNVGTTIQGQSQFQIYDGLLPPLPVPVGLTGIALPGGRARLEWETVEGAADYQLYRKAPGETELTPLARTGGATFFEDAPDNDGPHVYAVASVRSANSQEALSDPSQTVTVEIDRIAPDPPENFQLELQADGIHASWQAPGGEVPSTYNLYRSDQSEILSVTSLNPLIEGIEDTETVDSQPSGDEHAYAATSLDEAGNESGPSNSVYLNFDLLPVSPIGVVKTDDDLPVLTWSHPNPETVAGYRIFIGEGADRVEVQGQGLWADTEYTDSGYDGNTRRYTVVAVDNFDAESLERSIVLPKMDIQPVFDSSIRRNYFNPASCMVKNLSSASVENIVLELVLGGYSHDSETFRLDPGEEKNVSLIVAGHADLPDTANYSFAMETAPRAGESARIVRTGQVQTTAGALPLELSAKNMIRGGAGKLRFRLDNPCDVDIDIVTAENSGDDPSGEIHFYLMDEDGNVLSSAQYTQVLGDSIVNLSNGATVARVAPGERFESLWADIVVPESAGDIVYAKVVVDQVRYRTGTDDEIALAGPQAVAQSSVGEAEYECELIDVSPAASFGEQDIVIVGLAMDLETGMATPFASLQMVLSGNGFERTYDLETEVDGGFTFRYEPLPADSGTYRASCIYPGMLARPEQGEFSISGLRISPKNIQLDMPRQYEQTLYIQAVAGTGSRFDNLEMQFLAEDQDGDVLPDGIHFTFPAPITIEPGEVATLSPKVYADDSAEQTGAVVLRVVSSQSGTTPLALIQIQYSLSEARPVLTWTPSYLETGVAFGSAVSETLTLKNIGLAPSTNTRVALTTPDGDPPPDWISIVTPTNIGAVEVGDEIPVGIEARPDNSVEEKTHSFKLTASGDDIEDLKASLYVNVSQSGQGSVLFHLSDIYTATLDEYQQPIPGLEGATVYLQNEQVEGIKETRTSDALGKALFENLPVGQYKYRAVCPNHRQASGRIQIKPGATVNQEVFLDYDLVTVEWEVNEISLEDRYEIYLKTTFETNVPAPVVVIEPAGVNLPDMLPGEVYRGEFTIVNHGLVRADDVRLELPESDDQYSFEFLADVPESIEAMQRLVVPYRIVKLDDGETGKSRASGGCSMYSKCAKVDYCYECANGKRACDKRNACWLKAGGDCGGGGGAATIVRGLLGTGGGGDSSPSDWEFCEDCKPPEPACEPCKKPECAGEKWKCVNDPDQNGNQCGTTPETDCYVCNGGNCERPKADCGLDDTDLETSFEVGLPPTLQAAISQAGQLLNTIPVLSGVDIGFEAKSTTKYGLECCKDCGVALPKEYEKTGAEATLSLSGSVSTPSKPNFEYSFFKFYRIKTEVGAGLEAGLAGKGSASYSFHDTECENEDCETITLGISGEIYGKVGTAAIFALEELQSYSCLLTAKKSDDCYELYAGVKAEIFGQITGTCGVTRSWMSGSHESCQGEKCELSFGGATAQLTAQVVIDVLPFIPEFTVGDTFTQKLADGFTRPCSGE